MIKEPRDPILRNAELNYQALQELEDKLEVRINGIEKAISVAHDDLVRVPTEVQKAITGLRELLESKIHCLTEIVDEQFTGVAEKFGERDKRFDLRDLDSKTAMEAALTAAKENIGKLEIFFTKQIDGIGAILNSNNGALNDKIDDLKDRVSKLETKSSEQVRGADRSTAIVGTIIAAVVGLVIVLGAIGTVATIIATR
jgi:septation ring formation regulator EzrA